ncbi:MAG: T9SS type A sorting domain-containing protein [Muribaculaceae bacterium]|nr:T9SS type A sorting domain-containing protein [Muribaculaceae bacterium]
MKKFTILAAMAMAAGMANAQYTCDPSTQLVIDQGAKSVYFIVLSNGAITELEAAGATTHSFAANPEDGCNLWYWDGFVPADETYPRVDMEEGGYVSVQVTGTAGWSGAGFNAQAPGLDMSSFNENTHFHMAYMSPTGNGPVTILCTLLDNTTDQAGPFKFALGQATEDNGVSVPSVGPKANDDWQGIDLTFAQMKKLFPNFKIDNNPAWTGNYFTWLAGNVAGQTMAFDAMYFWSTESAGISSVESEAAQFVLTDKTLSVLGGTGIELYNMAGATVKSTTGTVIGIDNLAAGVYVAKSGNMVKKVVVRK